MGIKKLLSKLKELVKSKKFWLFALSFVMVSAASVGITLAIKNGSEENNANPPRVDYANDGNYYLSAVDGDYTLSLADGKFALTIADETKIGEYSFSENDIQLVFEDNTLATATYANGTITLAYNNATYKFVQKVEFTVSYDVDGETVNSVKVMNGKTVAQPAAPAKEGFIFVGWYADQAFATPFVFDATPVTANTTVYARFVEKTVGQDEFKATFIVDGEVVSVVSTVNGVLQELPAAPKAADSFVGWWMSDEQNVNKLTCQYTGQTLKEDVNLYAVWEGAAPLVSVTETGAKWNALGVGVNYTVNVYVNGSLVKTQKTTSTEYEYDFTTRGAASYVVEVSANGQTAKAYYNYNALDRVSNFVVAEPSMLVFNGVDNAEKYLITVDCGNESHEHDMFDNGSFTYFNFANCEMKEGGIEFTVTAVANGYTSSVSEVFTYERKLDAVTGLSYNAENGSLEWNTVEKAMSYVVEVTQGEQTDTYNVNGKTFSMKNYSGEISVKVSAVAVGYTSSAATLTYTSTKLGAPTGVTVAGNAIQWTEVEGAVKYNVMIDGVKIGETDTLAMDIPANYQAVGLEFAVSVQAVGASEAENSYYCDPVAVKYGQLNNVTYANGMLSWSPVGGASKYEYTVNNGAIQVVAADATSTKVKFTKAGDNVIVLTAKDSYGNVLGQSQEVVVKAYELVLESRSENGFTTQYLAIGDEIDFSFPNEMVKTGYKFDAWYNVPGGADANGSMFESTTYVLNTPYTLYAYWVAEQYEVVLMLGQEEYARVLVSYNANYTLPVPNRTVSGKAFGGWQTETGVLLTDAQGESVVAWKDLKGDTLYPTWVKVLNAEKVASGDGYAVSMAPELKEKALKEITIPSTFTVGDETLPVVAISAEAFYNCKSLEVINIPDTIRTIYIGEGGFNSAGSAFFGCDNLKEINVYATGGTHETYFSSVDGVLLRHAQPNVPMEHGTELYYFPIAKTGVYEVPNEVEFIPQKTFQRTKITDVIIPTSVSLIGKQAFERSQIKSVVFSDVVGDEEANDLVLSASVFAYCYSLTTVDLPARLAETNFGELTLFDGCTILREVNVVGANGTYTSKDGMVCDASGRQIIYCPVGKVGEVVIPVSVQGVGEGAFKNCTKITSLVVGANVVEIGKEAFMGCRGITTIDFRGQAGDLTINEKAFYGCTSLRELTLSENVTKIAEKAFGNTPLNTRVYLKASANIEYANGAFADDNGKGYVTNIVIGENMGAFEIKGVFAGCQIKDVTVEGDNANYFADEDGVLYNGDQTQLLFYPKKLIENYQLPETVTTIAAGVFEGNNDFTTFTIGVNVTTISASAFKNMARLESVVFEEGRTAPLTIGDSAFEGCSALQIELPETLTSIGAYAFKDCTSITTITLPSTLKTMGNETATGVFDGCSNLAMVNVAENSEAFESRSGILYGKTDGVATTLIFVPADYEGDVVIPKTVHTIPEMAFYGHAGITSVSFEDNEAPLNIRIGASAFAGMSAVQTVILPKNLTIIATGLFENSSVKEVFVPNTVNTIQLKAFYKAASLATLTFEEGNEDNILVLEDAGWATVNAAESKGGILYGVPLTTSGLVFPERVKRIPDYYFGYSTFASVTIPASIEYIGVGAFVSSTSIKSITFAGDASTRAGFVLGHTAFSGCSGVTSLVVPASITKYEGTYSQPVATVSSGFGTGSYYVHGAFRKMTGLTSLTFEEGVTNLSVGMFYGSGTSSTMITLPDSLVTIGDAAFNTAKFKSVTFGKNLTTIGKHAFSNATNLATVDFSKNEQLTSIGDYAFEKCTKLTTVALPDNSANGVEELTFGKTIFSGCTALTTATIPATVKNLNSAFSGCTKVVVTQVGNEASADANGFMLTADGKRLVKYSGTATEVTIPDGVEIIGDNAFSGNSQITKVTLPTSVKVIEGYAFQNCTKLATIEGGDGLMSVGAYAFSATVITSIDLTGILTVGEYAFYNCKKLTEVILDNDMTTIANSMFEGCSVLAQIDLPVNLTTLGFKAFYSSGLTSIVLPSKLKHTDMTTNSGYWFGMCQKLASVTIESTDLGVLPYYAFYYCTSLESIDIPEGVTAIIGSFYYASKLKDITFPSTLTALYGADVLGGVFGGITGSAIETLDFSNTKLDTFDTIYDGGNNSIFSYMSSLKTIIFPETVTTLPVQLFEGSNNLVTVIAPGVTVLQTEKPANVTTFMKKSKLTTVQFSPEFVSISDYAFYGCSSLEEFTFTDNLTSIGEYAFENTKLSNLAFGEKLETIGAGAFYNTLVETVTLPASLTEIGELAFGGCKNLTRFEVSTSNPRYYTGSYGELYDNTNTLICFPVNSFGIDGIVDMSTMERVVIGAYAFSECKNIQKVILPADMYEIPEGLFADSAITEITIPNGVTKIGAYAFNGCTGLTEITIPENVNEIGTDAFFGCTNLTKFVVDPDNANYRVGNYGELYDSANNLLCFPAKATIEGGVITLADGVKLPAYAFSGLTGVTEVVLPSDVKAIPAGAFENSSITTITIPASVTSIDDTAFAGSALETLVFADRTDNWTIPAYLFQGVTTLKTVTMGSGIASIGNYAFDGCSSLTNLTLSSSLTSIGTYVFRNCTALTSLTLPNGVTSIGNYAFDKCTALTSITLSTSLKKIGNYAFRKATKVSSIYVPLSVTSMGTYVFNGWTSSQTIYLARSSAFTSTGWKGSAKVVTNAAAPTV